MNKLFSHFSKEDKEQILESILSQKPSEFLANRTEEGYDFFQGQEVFKLPEDSILSFYNNVISKINKEVQNFIKDVSTSNLFIEIKEFNKIMESFLNHRGFHFTLFGDVTQEKVNNIELNLNLSSMIYIHPNELNFKIEDLKEFYDEFKDRPCC
jgi:hypothetical protein